MSSAGSAARVLALPPLFTAGMTDAMVELLPNAPIYHVGMYRNPGSNLPVQYYNRLPKGKAGCDVSPYCNAQQGAIVVFFATDRPVYLLCMCIRFELLVTDSGAFGFRTTPSQIGKGHGVHLKQLPHCKRTAAVDTEVLCLDQTGYASNRHSAVAAACTT